MAEKPTEKQKNDLDTEAILTVRNGEKHWSYRTQLEGDNEFYMKTSETLLNLFKIISDRWGNKTQPPMVPISAPLVPTPMIPIMCSCKAVFTRFNIKEIPVPNDSIEIYCNKCGKTIYKGLKP